MSQLLWIAAGAVLGANARYLVGLWAAARFGAGFPYGTLFVNLVGSFVLGFVVVLGVGRLSIPPQVRLFLAVGFLGSFTTFSSFSAETLLLLEGGGLPRGLLNILANNAGGLVAAWLGATLARALG
jgi:CrcB protein